ncbi:MAG TPA: ShlB/FhaC/HecB family hemolysin secretion/activation protein [Caulobacteraceae bacterium]|nr:ShlB/FhaC/HecB family hemolysin secretion/activation protein [Caulobacteraceae bacterium]
MALAVCLPAMAHGQTVSRALPSPQQLNPAQQPQAAPPQNRGGDLLAPPEHSACPMADSPLTFTLTAVEFQGATAVKAKTLEGAYASLIGQTIKVAEICAIRDRAADIFFRRGFLARVEIPEQRIAGGKLVLTVVEARIAAVRVHGEAGAAQSKVEDYIEKLRGLTPFDLRTAERYLLLASDVPGMRISAALRPSPQGRGAVDLDVTVTRQPVDMVVDAQNFGSQSLGPYGGLVRGDLNGVTRFGDRTTLVAYSTLFDDKQQVLQLVEEARVGSDGWLGRLSVAYGRTHPGANVAPLDLYGKSLVGSFEAVYPLWRSRRNNLNLTGGFDYVDQSTDFGSGGALNDDHLRILYGRADADIRRFPFGREFDGHLDLQIRKGLEILGASRPGEAGLSRLQGRADALVFRADGTATQQWTSLISTEMAFEAQYTDTPLLTYEQLAVGNLTIGRGYDPSSVTGDTGVSGTFELRAGPIQPIQPLRWLNVQGYGFYDIAKSNNLNIGGENLTVRSAGGGLRFRLTQRVSLDIAYAHPFDKISANAKSRPPDRALVNLVSSFF